MAQLQTSTGESVFIDDSDFEKLSKFKWYLSNGYAISNEKRKKMHRIILDAKPGEIVDHVDRNKLNNTRSNLRIVSKEENIHNQKKRSNTKNRFKGVFYQKKLNLWQARCRMNHRDYFLGYFASEIAAAYAYNLKAKEVSNCALINELPHPESYLQQILIDHRRTIPQAENKSKVKGIYWHKKSGRMKCGKWEVKVRIGDKYKSLGRFIDEQDAIKSLKQFKSNLIK